MAESSEWSRMHDVFERAYQEYETRQFENHLFLFAHKVTPFCGSPIEKMMGAALYFCYIAGVEEPRWVIPGQGFAEQGNKPLPSLLSELEWRRALLVPQLQVKRYRIDFGLFLYAEGRELKLAIECDGHDFHEKTKEQAAHDKKRDRIITAEGYRIFRFTGSEINRDAIGCASEVAEVAGNWLVAQGPTI